VWAMGEGIAKENPVIGTNTPEEAAPRDRVLDAGEVAEIWAACRDDDYGKIVRLLLLTGARRQEIGSLRWSEIDLEKAVVQLPPERTKNGHPHAIPLSPFALSIIGAARQVDRDFLFGHGPAGFRGWRNAFDALVERVREHRQKAGGLPPMEPWTVHDLRRTFATGLGDLGVQPHVIEAALNHFSGAKRGVAGTYNKSAYQKEVAAALTLWAEHVRVLVEGGERKVLPGPGHRGRLTGAA
jgi:integrase